MVLLFVAAGVLSAVFMGRVAINYNLVDYLGKGTQTKVALDIIEEEFGMSGNLQVMAKNASADTDDAMQDTLERIPMC